MISMRAKHVLHAICFTFLLCRLSTVVQAVTGGAVSHAFSCFAPAIIFGTLTLRVAPLLVERVNTCLTAAILAGFGLLCRNVLCCGGHTTARLVSTANWRTLFPTSGTWALPVFLSVLQFGAAVPVVVQAMQASKSVTNARKTRLAMAIGAGLPLVLGLLWTAVTASSPPPLHAVGSTVTDPVLTLLLGPRAVAVPVQMLSAGAIGTTLIGAYLTLVQLFRDILSLRMASCAILAAILGPAILGTFGGPALYLPLLGASGAFPCTILYVLVPLLALQVLRASLSAGGGDRLIEPWLPGGDRSLLVMAALPVAMLSTSAIGALASIKGLLKTLVRAGGAA